MEKDPCTIPLSALHRAIFNQIKRHVANGIGERTERTYLQVT